MKPAAGMRISDKVKLVRPLGVGGMGSVWVARHLGLDCDVAVKFIAKSELSERHMKRFKREASLAAKIKSPHVVRIFDFGAMEDGTPYIVMELLAGQCLADHLADIGVLSLHDTALMVSQVSVALKEAHDMDIVHRDIKPGNIFLVESGYQLFVKLLDFGVAKQTGLEVHDVTSTGAIVGTPHYMSPEQLLSTRDVDHRADLWALAVVAYHAVVGRVPFAGKTMAALSMAIAAGRFTPVSALVDDAGPELDMWFKLALCRNIKGRYRSAEELAKSFVHAVEGAADRESALVPRSTRPSQLAAAGIRVSDSGAVSIREPETDVVEAEDLSDESDGELTVTADPDPIEVPSELPSLLAEPPSTPTPQPSPRRRRGRDRGALWFGAVAVVTAFLLLRNWGFWRAGPMTASPIIVVPQPTIPRPPAPEAHPVEPPAIEPRTEPAPKASETVKKPQPPVRPVVKPVTQKKPQPPDCSEPFIVDENGDIHPRPECLR